MLQRRASILVWECEARSLATSAVPLRVCVCAATFHLRGEHVCVCVFVLANAKVHCQWQPGTAHFLCDLHAPNFMQHE